MSNLQRAIEIATKAHAGQVDKAGKDYIEHPLRVMAMGITESEKIVGNFTRCLGRYTLWT